MLRLRLRYGALTPAHIVQVLWGAYHCSVIFWKRGSTIGGIPPPLFQTVRGIDLLGRATAGLLAADGVGLRPDWWQPARGNAHARDAPCQ